MESQGPLTGQFSDESSVGTAVWGSVSNAASNNSSYASATLNLTDNSTHYLAMDTVGFSVPTDATITGVVVSVNKYQSAGVGDSAVTDNSVRLFTSFSPSGNEKATGDAWPETDDDEYISYGGPTDLWGLSLTPSDINTAGFGVGISAIATIAILDDVASVDHVRMTVFYEPATPTPTIQSSTSGVITGFFSQPII